MAKIKQLISLAAVLLLARSALADTNYQVCFTPQQNCTAMIVSQIDAAKTNIWVQAYSFTSHPIGDALVRAKERGVDVEIIMDKSNFDPYMQSSARFLLRHGIKLWDDNKLNIAHNKVMIFDGNSLETGSFNYTYSAQNENAENVLIIHNQDLAQAYLSNWKQRQQESVAVQP
jgi:phosphatidylserine/phosphatidylglycerophosphate/cardiolipin synthase-like enzyme